MKPELHLCFATAESLFRYHDPVRIHGYCATCPDHGRVWSCPPFGEPVLAGFPAWTCALLVTLKTWMGPETRRDDMIEGFHASRRSFRGLLVGVERCLPGTTALVAGYCQGCEACCRPQGHPCRAPSELRYSLEAVGFDVSALTEQLVGQRIQWPKEGNPDYLLTVGALLCPEMGRAEEARQAMMEAWEERQHG